MSIVEGNQFESMVGDPDDHRPGSVWALVVDPGDEFGRIDDLAVVSERIAPGDRIPLHVHRVNEVILPQGSGRFTLGPVVRSVDAGAVVFVPAGVPHSFHNDGEAALALQAVFPTTRVWLRYLERNPAPGTEGDEPQPGATYDLRTGDVEFDPT
jgi:quercetin dioxygenase-like cupin family protein